MTAGTGETALDTGTAPDTDTDTDTAALRGRIAALVSRASDGDVTADEILAAGGSLTALGVTSLAFLRLIDALEEEFGVLVDLDGPTLRLDGLDELVAELVRQGAVAGHDD